ncbi:MAG: hypothetical protein J07HX5_00932 [halophilic archaeon J07HX5]|nr:MAG: hypothetical protein J07HX5_00932 [halophilic archaeon J07HX5]
MVYESDMIRDLTTAVRQRVSRTTVALWALTLCAVYFFTGDIALVAGIMIAYLFIGGMDLLGDVPGVDERWVKAAVPVVVGAVSGVWLWLELSSPATGDVWPPVLALVACLWLALDVRANFVQDRRLGRTDEFDDLSSAEAVLVMQHGHLVADHLQDGPMTVDELAAACDLTVSRVEEVIDLFGRDGSIYPVDSDAEHPRYALDEQRIGLSGLGRQAAGGLSGLISRLLRPFTEQF